MSSAVQSSGAGVDFYDLFLKHLDLLTSKEALAADDICKRLDLKKTQVDVWLKQGIREKRVRRFSKPVRYCSLRRESDQEQLDLPVGLR